MKAIKSFVSILVFATLITACKKENTPPQKSDSGITAEKQNVKTYEIINLIAHQSLADKYQGTFGAVPVELLKTSDTTLSFYIPDVPAGAATLKFDLAQIKFSVTQTTAASPDKFIADLTKDFETQVGLLSASAPNEAAEINALKEYRQEVIKLFNSLADEEKRQTMLFYEANKEVVQLMSTVALAAQAHPMNRPAGVTRLSGSNFHQARMLSAASMDDYDCPKIDFQSYYGCLASQLGKEAKKIVVGSAKVLTMLALAKITASLAPATFGISAVGTTLAAGAAGYLLATQVCPAVQRFGRLVGPFLKANWIFASTLFETVAEEFPSEIALHLNLKPKFRAIAQDDTDVNAGAAYFISAMETLKGYWGKMTALFGSFPSYQNTEEPTTLESNEISISGISNPNVQYVSNKGQAVTFKSLSGEDETFTYDIRVSKEGFVEQQTLNGKVVAAQDSLTIYKAACTGIWTVKEYELNKLIATWTLELSADGSGTYRLPGVSSQTDIRWYIQKDDDGYRYKEYTTHPGPWYYLERSSVIHKDFLTYPVTSFSMYYIGTTVEYIKD
ncbi:hypothetical protein [Parapedobacter sp. 2B3]|uniref:hypothetical protein n=1 Tax=Parapedobacter sp. 2B3 TaxID=3342381 RepID=UPI0035B60D07